MYRKRRLVINSHIKSFEDVGPFITCGKFEGQCSVMTLQNCNVVVENGKLIACVTKKRVRVPRMVYVVYNSCY